MKQTEAVLNGIKLQMSQVFEASGAVVPVTLIKTTDEVTEELQDKDIKIIGISKGKGFTGVMKRWNFAGAQATRGQSDKPRAPGAIGSQTPGRVFKGKKMAGRHGNKQVTISGARIVRVFPDTGELMVSGPVPGARNSKVTIKVLGEGKVNES